MTIIFNNRTENISESSISLERLAELKNIPARGTAIAVNGTLIPASNWSAYMLNDRDDVIVVSAAYGG